MYALSLYLPTYNYHSIWNLFYVIYNFMIHQNRLEKALSFTWCLECPRVHHTVE